MLRNFGLHVDAVRVFIGASAGGEDAEAQAVAEYTLRKYASKLISLTWLTLSKKPEDFGYHWDTEGWGTPFSGLRWGVPALCGFKGKAIYSDCDVIFRADIAELWNQTIPDGAFALVKGSGEKLRTCVMLLDCEKARNWIADLDGLRTKLAYKRVDKYLKEHPDITKPFKGMWNCVDRIDLKKPERINDPNIKLIHYSSQWHQPHLKHAVERLQQSGRTHWFDGPMVPHPSPELQEMFDKLLEEAIEAGYKPSNYDPVVPFGKYQVRSYAKRAVG